MQDLTPIAGAHNFPTFGLMEIGASRGGEVSFSREKSDSDPIIVGEGSYTDEEVIELARRLERAGVAALDISGGSNESPQLSKYCIQPPSFPRGCLAPYSKPIKRAVSIPVLVAGRLVDPEDAEAVVREGCADFVSIGRALAGRGHHVEIWEKSARVGGQIHPAVAAPDKKEVEPIWSYRWEQIRRFKVPVKTAVAAAAHAIRELAPDLVIIATGARPGPSPFDTSALDPAVKVVQAWDYLTDPESVPAGAQVTVVGGGMVGVEAADLLTERRARVAIIEVLPVLAKGIPRNNRLEILERLERKGATVLASTRIEHARGKTLTVRTQNGAPRTLDAGDYLMIATGAQPEREVVATVEAAGVPYVLVGDCYRPGDFLTCLRDAWMVALSVDHRFREAHVPARTRVSKGSD